MKYRVRLEKVRTEPKRKFRPKVYANFRWQIGFMLRLIKTKRELEGYYSWDTEKMVDTIGIEIEVPSAKFDFLLFIFKLK